MIETLYVANHTHTDIGFTDHQDVCFRQHAEFVTQALDVIEATAGHPDEARFRWTCEVTGPLERFLAAAPAEEVERFRRHNASGAMDVAAMQYNLTPLLGVEQMVRSLAPVRRLRERYDFLYVESTHPMRVDNGPPELRVSDFVAEWNGGAHAADRAHHAGGVRRRPA
jgi:alpha-mannosidase